MRVLGIRSAEEETMARSVEYILRILLSDKVAEELIGLVVWLVGVVGGTDVCGA
jgi:hypothetical protein